MSDTSELSVVCKSCGSEVSPYVTECPYCGARLRKRAPKLERVGDEITAKEKRRARGRRRGRRAGRERRLSLSLAGSRAYVTIAAIVAPAVLVLVLRATDLDPRDVGAFAINLPLTGNNGIGGDDWWRYLAAPFVYSDIGYLFVIALALAIFGSSLERRLGSVATFILLVGCGGLGMLAGDGIESAIGSDGSFVAAGGNGMALGAVAAWLAIARADRRRHGPDDDRDMVGAVVVLVVLLLLPLVDYWANAWAGLGGALVGSISGLAAGGAAAEE